MPGLKMADSAVLREKPVISLGNVPASEWTLPRILKIKISRDTKQLFRKPSLRRMPRLLSSPLLLSCFFYYLFLDPPGYVRTKKVLHTLRTANSRDWIQSYRFRRSGRTVDTACTGPRARPVNLRCRLLSSI